MHQTKRVHGEKRRQCDASPWEKWAVNEERGRGQGEAEGGDAKNMRAKRVANRSREGMWTKNYHCTASQCLVYVFYGK